MATVKSFKSHGQFYAEREVFVAFQIDTKNIIIIVINKGKKRLYNYK